MIATPNIETLHSTIEVLKNPERCPVETLHSTIISIYKDPLIRLYRCLGLFGVVITGTGLLNPKPPNALNPKPQTP